MTTRSHAVPKSGVVKMFKSNLRVCIFECWCHSVFRFLIAYWFEFLLVSQVPKSSVGVVFKYYNFDPALKVKTTLLGWPYAESGAVPMYPSDNVSWIATTHFVSQLPQDPFAPWIRQNCYSLIQNTLSTATCQYVTYVWGIFERHFRQKLHLLQKGLRAFRNSEPYESHVLSWFWYFS